METINIFKNESTSRTLAAGEILWEAGSPPDLMYVVKTGELEVLINGDVIETVGPGGLVGEMALIGGTDRIATVRAVSESELIGLDEQKFLWHVHGTPFFALTVLRVAVERLRRMDERLRT
jgi:CRP-like cAMP-binding protein